MAAILRSERYFFYRTAQTVCRLMSSDSELSSRQEEGGIRTITLNNPKKSKDLRVIVLRAAGPVFSAGHDLKELAENDAKYQAQIFNECSEVMNLVQDIPVPVIAEIDGLATAAGCQLVASCDIAVASEKSTFATPGVSVGLFCSTPGVAVARSIPNKVALHMLFTGHPISAREALMHGLVSKVVPSEHLHAETLKIASRICETSRPVVALGKRFFYKQILMNRNTAYREGGQTMVDNLQLRDSREGLDAFIMKRSPTWAHSND